MATERKSFLVKQITDIKKNDPALFSHLQKIGTTLKNKELKYIDHHLDHCFEKKPETIKNIIIVRRSRAENTRYYDEKSSEIMEIDGKKLIFQKFADSDTNAWVIPFNFNVQSKNRLFVGDDEFCHLTGEAIGWTLYDKDILFIERDGYSLQSFTRGIFDELNFYMTIDEFLNLESFIAIV